MTSMVSCKNQNETFIFGLQGKQIVRKGLKGDLCTIIDQFVELETVFNNESPLKILDFQVFNREYLVVLTQCQEVLLIKHNNPNSQSEVI